MGCLMFKRPHHQKVVSVLEAMNAEFLVDAKCYFGGGTAIALRLNEFRESVDVDFLCSDPVGWRKIRESVFDNGLNDFFTGNVELIRDVRTNQDKVWTVLMVDGATIKFEIMREARIAIECERLIEIPVPCLTKDDLFAEKLLANADRYNEKSCMSRDMIDLLVMEHNWGQIPQVAIDKAVNAYGNAIAYALERAKNLLRADDQYLESCLKAMGINETTSQHLRESLYLNQFESKPGGMRR